MTLKKSAKSKKRKDTTPSPVCFVRPPLVCLNPLDCGHLLHKCDLSYLKYNICFSGLLWLTLQKKPHRAHFCLYWSPMPSTSHIDFFFLFADAVELHTENCCLCCASGPVICTYRNKFGINLFSFVRARASPFSKKYSMAKLGEYGSHTAVPILA